MSRVCGMGHEMPEDRALCPTCGMGVLPAPVAVPTPDPTPATSAFPADLNALLAGVDSHDVADGSGAGPTLPFPGSAGLPVPGTSVPGASRGLGLSSRALVALGTVVAVGVAGFVLVNGGMPGGGAATGSTSSSDQISISTTSTESPCTFALTNALADGLAALGDGASVGYWTQGFDGMVERALPTYVEAVQAFQLHGQTEDYTQLLGAWGEATHIGSVDRSQTVSIPTARNVAARLCANNTREAIAARVEAARQASAPQAAPACCAGEGGTYTPPVPTAAEVAGCRKEMPRLWRGVVNGSIDLDSADPTTFAGQTNVNPEAAGLELVALRNKYGEDLQAGLTHIRTWCVLMPDES